MTKKRNLFEEIEQGFSYMNRKRSSEEQYNRDIQSRIVAILSSDGRQTVSRIASKMNLHPQEVRWHLAELRSRFEVSHNWSNGEYSV